MNVIQRPAAIEFAAQMTDYIIDTDSTITFSIQYGGETILSEEYVPDGNYQVRIRKLGKFCALALWGNWANGNATTQGTAAGTFSFLIGGKKDMDCFVIYSRLQTRKTASAPGFLSSISDKVSRGGAEWCSALMEPAEKITVQYTDGQAQVHSGTLYTHTGNRQVVSIDVSYTRICSLLKVESLNSYQIVHGEDTMNFHIDQTRYLEIYHFRFKNNFDCPETVSVVGSLTLKGGDESETGYLYGVQRKFSVKPGDEYTANSGIIFRQADYKLWHDFLNAQETDIQIDGNWYPIIITKQNYERDFRRNILKAVEFSFKMADPEQNGLIG